MTEKLHHQGIAIRINHVTERRWRWEVSPPNCVLGLQVQYGEVSGDETDAVKAAKAAIERQTLSANPR